MNTVYKLQRHWQEWGGKLEPIVKSRAARLNFPQKLKEISSDHTSWVLAPERPICITNAPMKASSTRSRENLKLALFVNGKMTVPKDDKDPCITHRCNLTIFRYDEVPHKSANLVMVDAMHFDVDNVDSETQLRTPFHPIYHVQRGLSDDDELFQHTLAEVLHMDPRLITVDQSSKEALGTSYLRLPTPQLDMFAVLTMIAADYFCNPGDSKQEAPAKSGDKAKVAKVNSSDVPKTKALFVSLLNLLKSDKNFAREGSSSIELRSRLAKAEVFSTACWYPESA